jgi:prevent-host-death family protein
MRRVNATEIKNRLGQYMDYALASPVLIEKQGRPSLVLLSVQEYERLVALEDAYWVEKAKEAEKSGWLGQEESERLLKAGLSAEAGPE